MLLNFHRILRDADPDPGFGESILTAMDAQEKEAAETPATPEKTEPLVNTDTPPVWDKTERRKGYEGEKRRASDKPDTDPEHDIGFELEAGKGNAKMKLSELKYVAKWIHENRGTLASMNKHREMAAKHPEFGKVMDAVISKSFDGDKFNGEFVTKTLAQLEGKVEKIDDKIEDKDELIDEMQSQLDDLDPDSPQAKILKKSIVYQKGLKSELRKQAADSQKRIDALEAKFNGVEKTQKDFISEQGNAEQKVEFKRLSEMYSKEVGSLTDKEKKDGYKFIDEDEQKEFDTAVRQSVASNSKDVKDDAAFVKLIHSSAKAVYEKMSKRRESWVNDYLKKKGQGKEVHLSTNMSYEEGKGVDKTKTEKEKDPLEGKTMGQLIADHMFQESG